MTHRRHLSALQTWSRRVNLRNPGRTSALTGLRLLANVRDPGGVSDAWFAKKYPYGSSNPAESRTGGKVQERTLKLSRTIQVLHNRLPTLLLTPLPQDILSPQITLHLFPTTHPHLPTVSGRIAYSAALWTAPVAWGRVPVVGNIRLVILSERMVKINPSLPGSLEEKLIVRWKTCGKGKGREWSTVFRGTSERASQADKLRQILGDESQEPEDFSGLFIFDFDEEGRIVKHVIEQAQHGNNWKKTTKFVNVTDWLIGKALGKKPDPEPGLAFRYCAVERSGRGKKGRYQR